MAELATDGEELAGGRAFASESSSAGRRASGERRPSQVRFFMPPAASQDYDKTEAPVLVAPRPRKRPRILAHVLSGTAGSLLAEMVLFPVDTVKLQIQTATAVDGQGFAATVAKIIKSKGISGLYQGLSGSLIKESFHSSNYFMWHGLVFRYVSRYDDTSMTPPMARLLLNLFAKQLNWLCTVPFEVIASVNQLDAKSPGFFATASLLLRTHGIGVFYRGLAVSMLLAINPAIMNTLITTILTILVRLRRARGMDLADARDHSPGTIGATTGVAKTVATILTYPLIRVKVLQQTQLGTKRTMVKVVSDVLAAEGVRGLYRGILAMSYKTVLWNSMMMFFKHMLAPPRSITPPGSPAQPVPANRLPSLGREPFPTEFTEDKLDEILAYLRQDGRKQSADRVARLEKRVEEATGEIREMKRLLAAAVDAIGGSSPRASTPNS